MYTDDEYRTRVGRAIDAQNFKNQELDDVFRSLGFDPKSLSSEGKPRPRTKARPKAEPEQKERGKTAGEDAADGLGKEAAGDPSPRAHRDPSYLVLLVPVL